MSTKGRSNSEVVVDRREVSAAAARAARIVKRGTMPSLIQMPSPPPPKESSAIQESKNAQGLLGREESRAGAARGKRLRRTKTVPPRLDPIEILFQGGSIPPQISPPRRGDAIDHISKVHPRRQLLPEMDEDKAHSSRASHHSKTRKGGRSVRKSRGAVEEEEEEGDYYYDDSDSEERERYRRRHRRRRHQHDIESIGATARLEGPAYYHTQHPVHIMPVPVYVPAMPNSTGYAPHGQLGGPYAHPYAYTHRAVHGSSADHDYGPSEPAISDASALYRATRRDPKHQIVYAESGKPIKLLDGRRVTEYMVACAEVIQRNVRGFLGRIEFVENYLPDIVRREGALVDCVDGIVEECIAESIVPDMLIEIFTHEGRDYDALPADEQDIADAADGIMRETVDEMCHNVVSGVIQSFVAGYLDDMLRKKEKNPLWLVVLDIIEEFFSTEIQRVVSECCSDMVSEHLFIQRFDAFMVDALQPNIVGVAEDAVAEVAEETFANRLMDRVMDEVTREVAETCMDEDVKVREANRERMDLMEIARLSKETISRSALRLMLRVVASNGEGALLRRQFGRLLSGKIARPLRRVQISAATHKRMQNVALRHMHQIITSKAMVSAALRTWDENLDVLEDDIDLQEEMVYA